MKCARKKALRRIQKSIRTIKMFAPNAHHIQMEEAADRMFIKEYVLSCLPYIDENPQILEFDGGIVYADLIISQKGGRVEYATKRGRKDRNNPITYEFDITKEIIDKKFDLIIATQVLGSFIEPLWIMEQLKAMLNPKGILIITVSGPAYPAIKGLVSFYSKEGLTLIGRKVFGLKNIYNIRSYGDLATAVCMLDYLSNKIPEGIILDENYKHEVISGILCINS